MNFLRDDTSSVSVGAVLLICAAAIALASPVIAGVDEVRSSVQSLEPASR